MQRQIITMKAFIVNEEKNTIFLIRRKPAGENCSKWEIPSGNMDLGETTTEVFKREVKKEFPDINIDKLIEIITSNGLLKDDEKGER